ncbi:MAG: DUF2339 domain-containing protein [Deltaproteobacteria bacterium]|nr:MAG: DUF2339 domain-containing protein [Deltaproteobacteria bacterium]
MSFLLWFIVAILLGVAFGSVPLFVSIGLFGVALSQVSATLRKALRKVEERQDNLQLDIDVPTQIVEQVQKQTQALRSLELRVSQCQERIATLERENRGLRSLVRSMADGPMPDLSEALQLEAPAVAEPSPTPELSAPAEVRTDVVDEPKRQHEVDAQPEKEEANVSEEPQEQEVKSVDAEEAPAELSSIFLQPPVEAKSVEEESSNVEEESPKVEEPQPESPTPVDAPESSKPSKDSLLPPLSTKAEKPKTQGQRKALQSAPPSVGSSQPTPQEESWEAFIGSKLLSYVGIGILVLGLVFLLTYSLTQMGPLGRCMVGAACGALLLGVGFFLEPREEYKLYGRIVMGGGWSVLYFTSYGVHHINAMKIVQDPILGTLILAATAGGMLLHSIRYRSESTTGVALLLSYVTLFVSSVGLYTHVAGLLLACLICVFAYRFRWVITHLVGVILLYSGYGTWLYFQGHKTVAEHRPEYLLASGFLVLLWALFKIPDFAKAGEYKRWEQRLVPVIGLLNLFGLALVRKVTHFVFQTKGAPATALYLGLLYIGISQTLRWRGRETIYRIDSTVAVVLMMVGLWCVFVPYNATMISWLVLGVVVWLYSFYRTDRYFRDLGNLVMGVATVMSLGGEWPKELVRWFYKVGSGELVLNMKTTALPNKVLGSVFSMGVVGAVGAIVVFAGSWWTVQWLERQGQANELSEMARERGLIVFSSVTMMWALYKMLPAFGCALGWSVLGLLLFLYGLYRKQFVLRSWSHFVLFWVIISGEMLGLSRIQMGLSMAFSAVLLFLDGYLTLRLSQREELTEEEVFLEKFLVMGATATLAVSASFLFSTFSMVLAWMLLGVVVFLYGYVRGDDVARWCAFLLHAVAAAFASIWMILGSETMVLVGNWRASRYVFLVLLSMLLSYGYAAALHRLWSNKETKALHDEENLLVSGGNLAFLLAGWYALPSLAVAVAYAMAGALWLYLSMLWQRPYLRLHSSIISILSGFWLFTTNMNAEGSLLSIPRRILSSLPVLGLWGYVSLLWKQVKPTEKVEKDWVVHAPAILSFMNFAAIQVLVYYHADIDGLGWGLHALLLLALVRYLDRPMYSLQAMIAMGMAGFRFCSVALHHVGGPWAYLQEHWALVLGPLAIFAAHLGSKLFLSPSKEQDSSEGPTQAFAEAYRRSPAFFGLLFCGVFLFVLTTLLPGRHFSLGWGLAGFVLGWYGLSGREKFFRWVALSLFGLAVGKIVFLDVFRFSTTQKIITFISVGLALLLLSFLYNRLKGKLAELLL